MRLAIHASSLRARPRAWSAARGLARRGHAVFWWGDDPPAGPDVRPVREAREARGEGMDVVIGAGPPRAIAPAAWTLEASALVLDVNSEELRRWGLRDLWCWSSLSALALVESEDAAGVHQARGDVSLEQFALWPSGPAGTGGDVAHVDVDVLERACERTLARTRGRALRGAAFLDRDGTLIVERGYLSDLAAMELLPGAAEAIRLLRAAGHPAVLVSNQSGVGRGMFTETRVHDLMARLRVLLRREGTELDAIYFCPHRPDEGCACRKPGTRLLERASEDLQLSLRASVMIGDKGIDVAAGQAAGGAGALVRTGYGREEESRLAATDGAHPDFVADDVLHAARWYVTRMDGRLTP